MVFKPYFNPFPYINTIIKSDIKNPKSYSLLNSLKTPLEENLKLKLENKFSSSFFSKLNEILFY